MQKVQSGEEQTKSDTQAERSCGTGRSWSSTEELKEEPGQKGRRGGKLLPRDRRHKRGEEDRNSEAHKDVAVEDQGKITRGGPSTPQASRREPPGSGKQSRPNGKDKEPEAAAQGSPPQKGY